MKKNKTALLMVDLQNDFCAGGNLAVPDADAVIPLANRLQPYFELVIATKDWHPADHMSFASNHPGFKPGQMTTISNMVQVLWPDHCVQDTPGSEFHPQLDTRHIHKIFFKGIDKTIDSYSAFYDNAHLRATGLADYLKDQRVQRIFVMGLATDYCVKYTCTDAVQLGFDVSVIVDACRGVNLVPGDVEKSLQVMREAGIKEITSQQIIG